MSDITPIFLQNDLLYYAFLTVLIEVPIFFILGYRQLKAIIVFTLANFISNIILNEFLLMQVNNYNFYIACGEITVVLFEYAFCRCLLAISNPKKLFMTILTTNIVSFVSGIFMFW